jgi:hypothetical protein
LFHSALFPFPVARTSDSMPAGQRLVCQMEKESMPVRSDFSKFYVRFGGRLLKFFLFFNFFLNFVL